MLFVVVVTMHVVAICGSKERYGEEEKKKVLRKNVFFDSIPEARACACVRACLYVHIPMLRIEECISHLQIQRMQQAFAFYTFNNKNNNT